MADDFGDKTEAPTPRRRQEAREQGQVARSADLTAAALMLAAVMLMTWFGSGIVTAVKAVMETTLGAQSLGDFNNPAVGTVIVDLVLHVAFAMLPIMVGMMLVAIAMNIAQVGFFLSPSRVQPKLEMLNPTRGLKKIFGGGQGVVSMLMNIAKMGLIGAVAYSAVYDRIGQIVGATQLSHEQIFGLGAQIMYDIAMRIAIFLLILAIIDYVYQRFKMERELRMTKQQVKDEMKRMDGDPQIKQRRRQIQMQRSLQRLKQDVPTADVIVTNPTHFAIAIKYESGTMVAPKVVAKGMDYLALKIREIAIENGVPILERPPLARALYKTVEVGQEVPEEYYAAVAEILAYVYELNGKARRLQAV
ncbi:MAG: flagellar biosynthesis protein FlhB [Anaerolineae bacterium]|nr:flagellar biosynthesis protein FlhB [Phycisphaerae bacterium]